jgi:hypothetical protein
MEFSTILDQSFFEILKTQLFLPYNIFFFIGLELTSRPHQHRSVQTYQREQYHQTTQTEETV